MQAYTIISTPSSVHACVRLCQHLLCHALGFGLCASQQERKCEQFKITWHACTARLLHLCATECVRLEIWKMIVCDLNVCDLNGLGRARNMNVCALGSDSMCSYTFYLNSWLSRTLYDHPCSFAPAPADISHSNEDFEKQFKEHQIF
jgi:hypothetical protein